MADVEFYFHYGCPWTYLAFTRLGETALRTAARIVWRPILSERLRAAAANAATTTAGPDPARARYAAKDLADWARFCGIAIRRARPMPARLPWAERGAVVASAAGVAARYSEAVFRAGFGADADIGSVDVVTQLAAGAGLDARQFRGALESEATLVAVGRNGEELLARGGFDSPTMFVGADMYFGHDRMPLVELALTRAAERPLIAPGAHGQI